MEAPSSSSSSLTLATESFSYSWLSSNSSLKPPLELDQPLRLSIYSNHQNFNFDVSINLQSPPPLLAHADELFSDGLIRPLFIDPFKADSYNCTTPDQHFPQYAMSTSPFSSTASVPEEIGGGISHGLLRKWRRLVSRRQNLRDLFGRFRGKLGWSRKNTRVGDIDHKAEWDHEASPKPIINGAYYCCDHENSIYEAVLHCKRSFEK